MSKIALVTGASRGIGRCTALALADAGFDVAISARTVREGEGRADEVAVPGSLETTASEIEGRGRRALMVPMDLLDAGAVVGAARRVIDEWGGIDILVNNGIYQGPGTMDRILELTPENMSKLITGNYVNQVLLIQAVVPQMVERRYGRIVNMVSGSAQVDPPAAPGEGGWGIAYSASKAAFGRVAGGVNAEFGPSGIVAFNVDPGNVITEKRKAMHPEEAYEANFGSAPPEATANVIAWLVSDDDALRFRGKWVYAPKLCADRGLLPGWPATA